MDYFVALLLHSEQRELRIDRAHHIPKPTVDPNAALRDVIARLCFITLKN